MVRDLDVEPQPRQPTATATAATSARPAGGRRARARADGMAPGSAQPTQGQTGSPPKPPEQGDGSPKERKPRNRRHGRPR
jgi:SecD/SecF fusion protein